jgi:CubicO group peptidase (beta-lactamase class C family)
MVVAIARHGKLAYLESFGFRDPAAREPMKPDTIFSIASMTKPMTSAAIMMLFEEGRLLLGDPVSKYLPQLAGAQVGVVKAGPSGAPAIEMVPPERPVTIQDLLRHTSGYVYGGRGASPVHKLYPASSSVAARVHTGGAFLDTLGKLPLYNQPGAKWKYSFSTDILGLVVEAISGKPLGGFLQERIFTPLNMADTGFDVPAEKKQRYALALPKDPDTGQPIEVLHANSKPLLFQCGGGCAASTVADYLRFAQMLANKGTLNGKRLLARRTVELMTSDQLGPAVLAQTSNSTLPKAHTFGLGFAIRMQDGRSELAGTQGDYTWGGAYGTYFWVDPKEDLVVVYMAHTPGELRLHYRAKMRALVLQALAD